MGRFAKLALEQSQRALQCGALVPLATELVEQAGQSPFVLRRLFPKVEPPKGDLEHIHYFCGNTEIADDLKTREPHRVARYIEEVAGAYHRWYDNCRVTPLSGNPVETIHRTRLWLNEATGQVIRNGLSMLGVSAPERM